MLFVCSKVFTVFLGVIDELAEQFFLQLINESLHSLAPRVMELAHKIAVSLR
jgi:hypothetical protein